MCGIVGYVGPRNPVEIILSGLHRLEYRGYDSAGIALCPSAPGPLSIIKAKGKIVELEKLLKQSLPPGTTYSTGIGHTRWATHGEPNQVNAHPHVSRSGDFA